MEMFLALMTYSACIIFMGRFILHIVSWAGAAKDPSAGLVSKRVSLSLIVGVLLDIILFRRLFRTNKLLWTASWTFHVSFILIIIMHLRYFIYPVPDFIISMQSIGIIAGSIMTVSLALILIIRATGNQDKYVSIYNFFLLAILLLTSVSGLLLKLVYRTNLVDIKAFMLGIVSLTPGPVPDSLLFIVHFILVLILISSLPFHLIAAPIITMAARRRDEALDLVMHEK